MDKEAPGGALECGSEAAAFWIPSLAKAAASSAPPVRHRTPRASPPECF